MKGHRKLWSSVIAKFKSRRMKWVWNVISKVVVVKERFIEELLTRQRAAGLSLSV